MYNQNINSTSIKTSVMETTIETRVLKVGDLVIIKEEYILYKGIPFEHVFIFLSINLTSTYGQVLYKIHFGQHLSIRRGKNGYNILQMDFNHGKITKNNLTQT